MRRNVQRLAVALAWLVLVAGCVSLPTSQGPSGSAPPAQDTGYAALPGRIEDYLQTRELVPLDNLRAVLVLVDGATRVEYYRHGFTATDHEHVWSVTKSVLATLVAIAIRDGLIPGLDTSLRELVPEYRKAMTPTAGRITLRQLMNHTSGMVGDPEREYTVLTGKSDPVAWALSAKDAQVGPPGTMFRYSSLGSHVVAAVLYSALQRNSSTKGQTILTYAQAGLFRPLGIVTEPAMEPTDPDYTGSGFGWARAGNVHLGSWGLRLTAPDMAKIGQLYLGDGVWQGTRLLPEAWVEEATTPGLVANQVGLLWWHQYPGGYAARGFEGQRIVVVPDKKAVIVTLCATTPGDQALDEIDDLISTVIRPTLE